MDEVTDTTKPDKVVTPKWLSYCWLIVVALITLQGTILHFMGQPIISRTGGFKLWWGDIDNEENSQHLTDWYTFSHIIHGIGFYYILQLLALGPSMPFRCSPQCHSVASSVGFRCIVAVVLEGIWEVLENSPLIIRRYRQTALGYGYSGDSIVNSMSDTLAMILGFHMANTFPYIVVIAYVIFTELLCAYEIRDNFILNCIQIIYPFESISRWQSGQN